MFKDIRAAYPSPLPAPPKKLWEYQTYHHHLQQKGPATTKSQGMNLGIQAITADLRDAAISGDVNMCKSYQLLVGLKSEYQIMINHVRFYGWYMIYVYTYICIESKYRSKHLANFQVQSGLNIHLSCPKLASFVATCSVRHFSEAFREIPKLRP